MAELSGVFKIHDNQPNFMQPEDIHLWSTRPQNDVLIYYCFL